MVRLDPLGRHKPRNKRRLNTFIVAVGSILSLSQSLAKYASYWHEPKDGTRIDTLHRI